MDVYYRRKIAYILQEVRGFVKHGRRKVICVSGNFEDYDEVAMRVKKSVAGLNATIGTSVKVVDIRKGEKSSDPNAVYLVSASMLKELPPGFIIIFEDVKYKGECERVEL